MRDFGDFFGLAFSALLPLISPLCSAFLFQGLAGGLSGAVYRILACKIAINTTIFLLAILATGTALLKFFGISLPVMQVAGGFVLAAMGWSLINQGETEAGAKRRWPSEGIELPLIGFRSIGLVLPKPDVQHSWF